MADYFTNFSLVLPLQDASQQQYALDLASKAASYRCQESAETAPADLPLEFMQVREDWSFVTETESDHALWLHSDSGGMEAVFVFIQHLLHKFNPKGRVEFQWSHDCSQPRADAYRGGAAIVTAQGVLTMSTSEWLQQHEMRQTSQQNVASSPAQPRNENARFTSAKIVLTIEGGVVHEVLADASVEVLTLDYDVQGGAAEPIRQMPNGGSERAQCYRRFEAVTLDSHRVATLWRAASEQ